MHYIFIKLHVLLKFIIHALKLASAAIFEHHATVVESDKNTVSGACINREC